MKGESPMINVLNVRTSYDLLRELPQLAFEDAGAFLVRLTREPSFLAGHILPFLVPNTQSPQPYIAASFGTREATNCLQVFVWPSGAATPIHDHTSWGAYHCVVGSLLEQRYVRLDDEQQPNTAHLRKLWQRAWSRGDGTSTVGAYENGIHRVANPSRRPAISVHLYGPRTGVFDGRDYDPSRDFVCDRLEVEDWNNDDQLGLLQA